MQHNKAAELATQIVIAAIQSGKLEMKDVVSFYTAIFEQLTASTATSNSTEPINMPTIGM